MRGARGPRIEGARGSAGSIPRAFSIPALTLTPVPSMKKNSDSAARDELLAGLSEDLSREYQAIIAYVVYSQVLKGAEYMSIAQELEKHAGEELRHALLISKQIDYLGGDPPVTAKVVKTSKKAKDMLRFDLENETVTIREYRTRVRQCEALGEFAMAEHIREILKDEQEHQMDLASALGIDVPPAVPEGA
jgi:bacterioferritin